MVILSPPGHTSGGGGMFTSLVPPTAHMTIGANTTMYDGADNRKPPALRQQSGGVDACEGGDMSQHTPSVTVDAIHCKWCGNDHTHIRAAEVRPDGGDAAVRVMVWCENCHHTTWIEIYTVKGQARVTMGQGVG